MDHQDVPYPLRVDQPTSMEELYGKKKEKHSWNRQYFPQKQLWKAENQFAHAIWTEKQQ